MTCPFDVVMQYMSTVYSTLTGFPAGFQHNAQPSAIFKVAQKSGQRPWYFAKYCLNRTLHFYYIF